MLDGRINADDSLSFGDEREFVWQWWRDAFTGRLEGMKERQREHNMESSLDVIPSNGTMDTEFEMYKTLTNEKFLVWRGWRPFRVEFCLFEVKRSGLLKESRRMIWKGSPNLELGSVLIGLGFSKHERTAVSYSDAEMLIVVHVMNLIRDSIREGYRIEESEIERIDGDGEESMGRDLVKNADLLSRGDFSEVERALLLYEAAVGGFGSTEALEKGVEMILCRKSLPDILAVELLDIFVGHIIPFGRLTESRISPEVLLALRGVVLKTCEKLIYRCERKMEVSRLTKMLLLVSRFGGNRKIYEAWNLMKVILSCSQSMDVVVDYARFYRVYRLCQSKGTRKTLAGGAALNKKFMKRDLGTNRIRNGDEEEGSRLGHNDSDVNERDFSAQNGKYEKRLLERAHQEGRSTNAMVHLAVLLVDRSDGVAVDAVRGKILYEKAIEEGGDVNAMVNLGNLLMEGAEGVAVDAVRGKGLYERAIEEGGKVSAMSILEICW